MPSTVTLALPKGPDDPGSVQVTIDGKDWLFQAGKAVDDVPDKVIKQLDAQSAKYDTGKQG